MMAEPDPRIFDHMPPEGHCVRCREEMTAVRWRCDTPSCGGPPGAEPGTLAEQLSRLTTDFSNVFEVLEQHSEQVRAGLEQIAAVFEGVFNLMAAAYEAAKPADGPPVPAVDTGGPVTSLHPSYYASGTAGDYARDHPDETVVPGVV